MNSALLLVLSGVFLFLGYIFYGRWLYKKLGINNENTTPAHKLEDGIDYIPAKLPVLFGHHFASIAGAAPIIGPIAAAAFGWVPVYLWIILAGIFIGGMHDFTALVVSVRNDGKSIGEVIKNYISPRGSILFLWFAWFTLVLVIASFTIVVSQTFTSVPVAGSSSILFMILAVCFGLAINKFKMPLMPATMIGVIILFSLIPLGNMIPLSLSLNTWNFILLAYIFIASVAPVWILLQPRDYLNSFLLYFLMIAGFLGILFYNPKITSLSFTPFHIPMIGHLFPLLFVTVACGAISGFHSIVSSGTTAKQLDKESDARPIGYGGMLIESLLAVMALITAITISSKEYSYLSLNPVNLFAHGISAAANHIPFTNFDPKAFSAMISLIVSAFALTSLDTATRLGRFILQELADFLPKCFYKPLKSNYGSTVVTVAAGSALIFSGEWAAIWPLFGAANQLLAFLALSAVTVWLTKKNGKIPLFAAIPAVIMFAVTFSALIYLTAFSPSITVKVIDALLVIISVFSAVEVVKAVKRNVSPSVPTPAAEADSIKKD